MRRIVLSAALAVALAAPAYAATPVEKPVKLLIGAVRYGKDSLALTGLDGDAQGRVLLGDEWAKATPKERSEFTRLFQELFAAMAFPKLRADLVHLDTTLYQPPQVTGDHAELDSTLVILHPLAKQEIKVRYDLHKQKGAWKVVDVSVLGTGDPSMLTGIRDQQVRPIFKDGGWDKLLSLMRARLAQVKKQ